MPRTRTYRIHLTSRHHALTMYAGQLDAEQIATLAATIRAARDGAGISIETNGEPVHRWPEKPTEQRRTIPAPFHATPTQYAILTIDADPDAEPGDVLGNTLGTLYPTEAAAAAALCNEATEIHHRITGRRDSETITDTDHARKILADAGMYAAIVPLRALPTVPEAEPPAQPETPDAMPLIEGSAADGLYVLEDYFGSRRFRIYDANDYGHRPIRRAGCHFDSTAALAALDEERARRAVEAQAAKDQPR